MEGLDTYHPGQKAVVLTPALRAKILAATRKKPKDGSTHWSCRKLAAAVGVSKDMVHRVWREAGLKPHRLERYLASDDPDFERKAADIIGLYLNPPQHAAVFCVDEKTAIQALDRLVPVLPLSPGRAERHGFEYYRHRKRGVLRHAQSTCVCLSETTAFHLFLHSRLHHSEQAFGAIARAQALPYSPPTPTSFSGNLYYRHKGASGSLQTALSKLTRRSTSPLTSTLRRRVSPDSVLTSSRTWSRFLTHGGRLVHSDAALSSQQNWPFRDSCAYRKVWHG